MGYRHIEPMTLMNQTISGVTAVDSKMMDLRTLVAAGVFISFGATLNGTLQVMGSIDGISWADMGAGVASMAGVAGTRIVNLYGLGINYIKVTVTPTSGSANVTITGSAKGA